MSDIERLPPQNLDAERSVLGSVLLSSEKLDEVRAIITTTDMFYSDSHRTIFDAFIELSQDPKRGKFLDAVIVADHLDKAKMLDDAGGVDYLMEVLDAPPHSLHAEYYARIVRDKWAVRQVIYAATEAVKSAYDEGNSVDEIVAKAQSDLQELGAQLANADEGHTAIADLLLDVQRDIETRSATGTDDRVSRSRQLGQRDAKQEHGDRRAARPSQGKSALCVNIAEKVATTGKRVLFFSVEQGKKELAERILCSETGLTMPQLRGGQLSDEHRELIFEANNRLASLPFDIFDSSESVAKIAAKARLHTRRNRVDLVVVDYLQLVEPESKRIPREQQVSQMSRGFKRLGNELDCPILIAAQMNREIDKSTGGKQRMPRLSDLRESGSLEQDSDMVWFIHKPVDYDPMLIGSEKETEAFIVVRKNRNGATGEVEVQWFKETMQFRGLPRDYGQHGATEGERVPYPESTLFEDEARR